MGVASVRNNTSHRKKRRANGGTEEAIPKVMAELAAEIMDRFGRQVSGDG